MNLIQKYKPYGIAVTDLSAQLWCEKQLEFALEKGRKEMEEMKTGKDRHRQLHEEIAILVKVEPKTLVDSIALKLHNTQIGLKQLIGEGITRELDIFGKINLLFVTGKADELNLRNGRFYMSEIYH